MTYSFSFFLILNDVLEEFDKANNKKKSLLGCMEDEICQAGNKLL